MAMAKVFTGTRKGLEGVAELSKQLDALGRLEDGKAIRAAVRAGMTPALRAAKQNIPTGTKEHRTYKGRLVAPGFAKRSIVLITSLSKDKQKATAIIGVKAEAFYAIQFVEMGTSKMAAQPWLRPAFYDTRQEQEEALAAALRKAILKAVKQP
jgi:HK97 gp10 family phage protein